MLYDVCNFRNEAFEVERFFRYIFACPRHKMVIPLRHLIVPRSSTINNLKILGSTRIGMYDYFNRSANALTRVHFQSRGGIQHTKPQSPILRINGRINIEEIASPQLQVVIISTSENRKSCGATNNSISQMSFQYTTIVYRIRSD